MDRSSRFPLSVDAAPPVSETASGARAKGRDSLFLMAQLAIEGDGMVRDVRVRNLSAGGLMVELNRPVTSGAAVTLTLRGLGDVAGKVAWCAEGRIGVAFDQPIDPLLARKPVGKGAQTPAYAKPQLR